jgi:hypothetical protein
MELNTLKEMIMAEARCLKSSEEKQVVKGDYLGAAILKVKREELHVVLAMINPRHHTTAEGKL